MGRKMRSERNQRLKVTAQVTVARQEFCTFCCENVSMFLMKKVPNLIKVRRLTTIVNTEQVSALQKHNGRP